MTGGGKILVVSMLVAVFCTIYIFQYFLNALDEDIAAGRSPVRGDPRLTPVVWRFGCYVVQALLLGVIINYLVGVFVPGGWDRRTVYVVGLGCVSLLVSCVCYLIVEPWIATVTLVTLNLPWTVDYGREVVRVFRLLWARGVKLWTPPAP